MEKGGEERTTGMPHDLSLKLVKRQHRNTACCPVVMPVDSVWPSPLIGNVFMSTSWSLIQDVGAEFLQNETLYA